MDPAQLSDDQLDDLAAKLAPRLPTGTHGDRVILSRRQFAAAATGTLGAGALMALGVDPASAQAAGSQGTASEPNDMFAYDLNVANGVTSSLPMNGNDIEDAGSVSAEQIGDVRRYAGAYGGEDADARLDNALAASSNGDVIYLEPATLSDDRTIDTQLTLEGTNSGNSGTTIDANWTLSDRVTVDSVALESDRTFIVDSTRCSFENIYLGGRSEITVEESGALLSTIMGNGDVAFASGTDRGSIGIVESTVGVTDDGNNEVL